MLVSGLTHLLIEQVAVITALIAYLTGIVTVRPHPAQVEDLLLPHVGQKRVHNESQVAVDKVVMVVIDALRVDHLVSANQPLMPHVHGLLTKGMAHGYVLRTATPTVTLPRIKSLVTGSIPGFMDVIDNFGASELLDDNIIQQWVDRGKRIHFYGDDTWIKLFPSHFAKQDGVTSFFVTDYTEVDRNVTRHISQTMAADDWDVLILHYLGLDHIGHMGGPMSPLIGPKLLEMDKVIEEIHLKLKSKGQDYVILVCGDHGMGDAGGHGGSSHSEVTTSAVLFSNVFEKMKRGKVREIKQVDLAPTLAFLTGVDVPVGNIGRPIMELFLHLNIDSRLSLHHNATKQLLAIARGSGHLKDQDNADLLFNEATRLHKEVLQKLHMHPPDPNFSDVEAKRAIRFYQDCQLMVSEALTAKLQSYDILTIISATSAVVMILTVTIWRLHTASHASLHVNEVTICWGAGVTVLAWLLCCAAVSSSHICHLLRPTAWLLAASFIYIFVMTAQILFSQHSGKSEIVSFNEAVYYLLVVGTSLHTVSLLGTSLVEEEHQTIYFLSNTLHLALIIKLVCLSSKSSALLMANVSVPSDEFHRGKMKIDDSPELPTKIAKHSDNETLLQKLRRSPKKLVIVLLISLVLSRLMRSWNSTGDKWKHLEDFGDGIRASGGIVLAFVVGLGLTIAFLLYIKNCLPLVLIICVCIFGRHFPLWGQQLHTGILESQIGHLAIFLLFIYGLFKAKFIHFRGHQDSLPQNPLDHRPEEEKMYILLRYGVTALSFLCLLLQRADNVGLVSLVLLQSWVFSSVLYKLINNSAISNVTAALAVNWLAFAHFFYQGNSNSLATVDVSAGFVGVTSYRPVIHGILIAMQTFGGSFLTYLIYVTYIISKDSRKERWQKTLSVWWCVRLATISLYLVNVTIQRYHLFIWSVFTPKLLYEGAHVLVLFCLSLCMWVVEKICTVLEVTYRFE